MFLLKTKQPFLAFKGSMVSKVVDEQVETEGDLCLDIVKANHLRTMLQVISVLWPKS